MAVEHAQACFIAIADDIYSQFCCEICTYDVKKFVKLIKRQIEFDKIFEERSIEVRLFNLTQVILIPSFRIVSLLCYGDNFSNTMLIQSPYHLDVSRSHRTL